MPGGFSVRGLNVMKGYLTPDDPGVVKPPAEGWHDTGDIVAIDDKGYVSIRGRLKRFAKIAGEMVSLAVVENCASAVWPDNLHAAAILPDPKKGRAGGAGHGQAGSAARASSLLGASPWRAGNRGAEKDRRR